MRTSPHRSLQAHLAASLLALSPCAARAQDAPQMPPPPLAQQPAEPATTGTNLDGQTWNLQRWDNGRLASVTCDGGIRPLREGQCHIGAYSGLIVTYHENGAVYEALHLNGGALDGVAETFDPNGRLLTRELWVDGARQPPPPQPEPEVPEAPPPLPAWIDVPFHPHVGFDARLGVNFGFNSFTSFLEMGPLVSVLFRVHPRLVLALTSGYLSVFGGGSSDGSGSPGSSANASVDYNSRYDVPITAAVHLYFSRLSSFQVYVLGGLGAMYANAQALSSPSESAWFTDMQFGAGIDQRFGRWLSFRYEFRLAGEFRTDGGPHVMVPDQNNNLQELMGHQFTTIFSLAVSFLP